MESHLYEQIAESLRRQIAQGDLRPGDRLPSVRQTAAQWDCTTGTVSRAYALLADEGLVHGRRGSGTTVTANPLPPDAPYLRQAALLNQAERFLLECLAQGYSGPQIQSAISVAQARWQTLQAQDTDEADAPGPRLRFVGSHDLTMDLLAQQLAVIRPGTSLELSFRGSLGGLMALARGEADLAGAHLWDEASDTYNVPFVRRVLPGQRLALVTLAGRDIGLIVAPGNPHALTGLAGLAGESVVLVNRQPGSGTRVWLDAQLARLGIDPSSINGYDTVRTTHMEVAQAVARDEATAGLGIHAAASAYGLEFVPLTQETYQLVIPEALYRGDNGATLRRALQAPAFLAAVAALGGYDTAVTGETIWVS